MISPELADCRFLDLFSGSGAIGIEALSRGARAYFVEKNQRRQPASGQSETYQTGGSGGPDENGCHSALKKWKGSAVDFILWIRRIMREQSLKYLII